MCPKSTAMYGEDITACYKTYFAQVMAYWMGYMSHYSSTCVNLSMQNLLYKSHQIFRNLNVSRLVLQLPLPNPLEPGVRSSMKM